MDWGQFKLCKTKEHFYAMQFHSAMAQQLHNFFREDTATAFQAELELIEIGHKFNELKGEIALRRRNPHPTHPLVYRRLGELTVKLATRKHELMKIREEAQTEANRIFCGLYAVNKQLERDQEAFFYWVDLLHFPE